MMAPYAWALVVMSTVQWCSPPPGKHPIDHAWPLSWLLSPKWIKEDPDEPDECELWSVTVNNHEELIEHFDTRDACVIYQKTTQYGITLCKTVEPPT